MPTCCDCNQSLKKTQFSKNQLRKEPNSRRCKVCVQALSLLPQQQQQQQPKEEEEETDHIRLIPRQQEQQDHKEEEIDPNPVTVRKTTETNLVVVEESDLPVTREKEKELHDHTTMLDDKLREENDPRFDNCVEVASKPDDVSSCTEHSSMFVKPPCGGLRVDKETAVLTVCPPPGQVHSVECSSSLLFEKHDNHIHNNDTTNAADQHQPDPCVMNQNPSQISMESQTMMTIDACSDVCSEVDKKKETNHSLEEIPNLVSVPSITVVGDVDPNCEKLNVPPPTTTHHHHHHVEDEVTLVLDSTSTTEQEDVKVTPPQQDDHHHQQQQQQSKDDAVILDATVCTKATSPAEDSSDQSTSTRIRVGICAMDKKARSKPMVSWFCMYVCLCA